MLTWKEPAWEEWLHLWVNRCRGAGYVGTTVPRNDNAWLPENVVRLSDYQEAE